MVMIQRRDASAIIHVMNFKLVLVILLLINLVVQRAMLPATDIQDVQFVTLCVMVTQLVLATQLAMDTLVEHAIQPVMVIQRVPATLLVITKLVLLVILLVMDTQHVLVT